MSDIAISVDNVSKRYHVYESQRARLRRAIWPSSTAGVSENWALRDVSFDVKRGEAVGIIGRNGSGKSTLLEIITGTLQPTSGSVVVNGRIAALLELGSGFNPEYTGRENVYLNGMLMGLTRAEVENHFDEIAAFADIGDVLDRPVKTYSSGMLVRLAFSVQVAIDPDILIVDEALAVGDVFFRQKCYSRLEQLRNSGAAILLVSHSMPDIEQYCDWAILLEYGCSRFIGSATEATKHYYQLHQSADAMHLIAPPIDLTDPTADASPVHELLNFWPSDALFKSAAELSQVDNGWGKCVRYVVCDESGKSCTSFAQGKTAVFYYEFLLLKPIAVPLGGLVLQNERGINVHGKGSLEYGCMTPDFLPSGSIIRCRQRIELKLEIGEYTFELGLATIDPETYKGMSKLNHEQIFSRITRVCHLPNAGVISIGWRQAHPGAPLTHHGVADLPGTFDYGFEINASK